MCVKSDRFTIQLIWSLVYFSCRETGVISFSLTTCSLYQSQILSKDFEATLSLSYFLQFRNSVFLINSFLYLPWLPSLSSFSGYKDTHILTVLENKTNQPKMSYSSNLSSLNLSLKANFLGRGTNSYQSKLCSFCTKCH